MIKISFFAAVMVFCVGAGIASEHEDGERKLGIELKEGEDKFILRSARTITFVGRNIYSEKINLNRLNQEELGLPSRFTNHFLEQKISYFPHVKDLQSEHDE